MSFNDKGTATQIQVSHASKFCRVLETLHNHDSDTEIIDKVMLWGQHCMHIRTIRILRHPEAISKHRRQQDFVADALISTLRSPSLLNSSLFPFAYDCSGTPRTHTTCATSRVISQVVPGRLYK